ncbi:MAG: tyrosine-type recombinase/integrase [Caldilineaceae bacterium]
MDVQTLLTLFLAHHESAAHSHRTIEWYRYQIQRFFDWLVESKLQNSNWLQPEVIELYLASSRHAGNESATVAGHYRALSAFFAWLVRRQYITQSPIKQVAPPKIAKKEPKRAVMVEYLALLDSIEGDSWIGLRDRLIIKTLFLCGVRRGECARLKQEDYRLPEHLLFVDGKTGPRLVPLLPAVEQAFVAYIYARPPWPTSHLFLSATGGGKPRRLITGPGLYQMVRRRCERAEVRPLNPHAFRHGLAMLMLNDRHADMSLVQRILGHSQITTTSRHYAEWQTDSMLREFTDKMGGLDE